MSRLGGGFVIAQKEVLSCSCVPHLSGMSDDWHRYWRPGEFDPNRIRAEKFHAMMRTPGGPSIELSQSCTRLLRATL
jgi:hypothetical protein